MRTLFVQLRNWKTLQSSQFKQVSVNLYQVNEGGFLTDILCQTFRILNVELLVFHYGILTLLSILKYHEKEDVSCEN